MTKYGFHEVKCVEFDMGVWGDDGVVEHAVSIRFCTALLNTDHEGANTEIQCMVHPPHPRGGAKALVVRALFILFKHRQCVKETGMNRKLNASSTIPMLAWKVINVRLETFCITAYFRG